MEPTEPCQYLGVVNVVERDKGPQIGGRGIDLAPMLPDGLHSILTVNVDMILS